MAALKVLFVKLLCFQYGMLRYTGLAKKQNNFNTFCSTCRNVINVSKCSVIYLE